MQMGGSEGNPETLAIVSARNILWTQPRLLIMLAETYLHAKHFQSIKEGITFSKEGYLQRGNWFLEATLEREEEQRGKTPCLPFN